MPNIPREQSLVVSLNGGPGSGKSTASAQLYSLLSWAGVNVELVVEYAKGKTFEGAPEYSLANQIKVFGKQHDYLTRCMGQVDVVVTDASLVNSLIYGETSPAFKDLVLAEVRKLGGLHVFLDRDPGHYQRAGRTQTLEEAQAIDASIRTAFDIHAIPYIRVPGGPGAAHVVFDRVMAQLGRTARPTLNTGLEIERKWLVRTLTGVPTQAAFQLEQHYLPALSGEIRVRCETDPAGESVYTLVIKTGAGLVRTESSAYIAFSTYRALARTATGSLVKARHHVALENHVAEVDMYATGLMIVEVEFATEADAHTFDVPAWFGREVTGDAAFSNYQLAHR